MPLELKICLFIAGISLMVGLTLRVHRQTQRILEYRKRQQLKRRFIHEFKRGTFSGAGNDMARVVRMDQCGGDKEPKGTQ